MIPGRRGFDRRARRPAAPVALALVGALSACSSPPAAPAPRPLAYGTPEVGTAVYAFADTTAFSFDTGAMGTMRPTTALAGTAELAFHETPAGLAVTVRFPRLRGGFSAPARGGASVVDSDVEGPFELSVTPRGGVTVLDTPSLSLAFSDVSGPERLPRLFFIHLPGRTAVVGDEWEDTVATRESTGGTTTSTWEATTTALVGDTLLGPRRVLRLWTRSRIRVEVTGWSGGVQVRQHLEGFRTGSALWDPGRMLLVGRDESGVLEGTLQMEAGAAPPIPVVARMHRRVDLIGP